MTATFRNFRKGTLNVFVSPVGGVVKSSPAGINCGGGNTDCSETADIGTLITLTATPDSGYRFTGWFHFDINTPFPAYGSECSGRGLRTDKCGVTFGFLEQSVSAHFSQGEVSLDGPSTGEVEEGDTALFRVTLLRHGTNDEIVADRDTTVGWRIDCNVGGATASTNDFHQTDKDCGSTGTVTIPLGMSNAQIEVPTREDTEFEPNESFRLGLAQTYNIEFRSGSTTREVLILNDDSPNPPSGVVDPDAPENADTFALVVDPEVESVESAPRGVAFVPGSVVDITIGIDQEGDAFYDGSQVCLSITEEARSAARDRIVSLSLYHYDATNGWERVEDSALDSLETHICGTIDGF